MKKYAKRNNSLDIIKRATEREMFQLELNEKFYTGSQLIELANTYNFADKIPNIIKLTKKVDELKIINMNGVPVLHLKLKKELV